MTDAEQNRKRDGSRWRVGRRLERLDDQWPPGLEELSSGTGNVAVYRINWSIRWHTYAYRQAIRWYNGLKLIQITAAATIPILTAIAGSAQWVRYPVPMLGGLIVVLEGVQQLKKYGQNALLWGQGKEALKREYFLYQAAAGVYSVPEQDRRDQILSERIELIIGNEVGTWAERPYEEKNYTPHAVGQQHE